MKCLSTIVFEIWPFKVGENPPLGLAGAPAGAPWGNDMISFTLHTVAKNVHFIFRIN